MRWRPTRFLDHRDPSLGFVFDEPSPRIFKLSTGKGSINQRVVPAHRIAAVEALYSGSAERIDRITMSAAPADPHAAHCGGG